MTPLQPRRPTRPKPKRKSAKDRGYDHRWTLVRTLYTKRHPLCERCDSHTTDVVVHHIVPISEGGAVYDMDNLETLCRKCHAEEHRDDA